MKKTALMLSFVALALIVGLAIGSNFGVPSITGQAQTPGPSDFSKSIQVGVVILAALGMLGITLLNVSKD